MHRLAFLGLLFAESFRVLNVFSFVFDSVNSVVNSVVDEMLSNISTKRHDSGSVGRFSTALVSVCLTHPEHDGK